MSSAPAFQTGPPPQAARRPVVLVADDYPENRRLVYFYLRDHYEVVQAASAEEAIELLAERPVDLAILDLNFCDGMSGIEAIQAIRREPATAHVRALALTAYAYPDDRERCLEAGFDDYVAKPVFKPALLKKLAELLGTGEPGGAEPVWISRPRADDAEA